MKSITTVVFWIVSFFSPTSLYICRQQSCSGSASKVMAYTVTFKLKVFGEVATGCRSRTVDFAFRFAHAAEEEWVKTRRVGKLYWRLMSVNFVSSFKWFLICFKVSFPVFLSFGQWIIVDIIGTGKPLPSSAFSSYCYFWFFMSRLTFEFVFVIRDEEGDPGSREIGAMLFNHTGEPEGGYT